MRTARGVFNSASEQRGSIGWQNMRETKKTIQSRGQRGPCTKSTSSCLRALPDDDDRKFLVTLLTSDPDDVSGGGASDSAATARRYLRPTSGLGAFPRPQEGRSLRLAEDEFKRRFPASEPAARRD